jgi:beta-mannanase
MLLSSPTIPRPDPVYSLQNIINGKFDPQLRNWMQDARDFGSPLIAEYGVEVDGWWFPWNGLYNKEGGSYADSVARFREAYRHIIRISRQEGAYNIRWVFHVDPWDEPDEAWNKFENYYPGDEWIDWVGASVYGRQLPSDPEAISFRYQMDWVYGRMRRLTNKAFVVCEFGTINDPKQAAWTEAALSDLVGGRWPKVIGFSWWNSTFKNDPLTGGLSDMRVQQSPELQTIFRNYVGRNHAVLGRPIAAQQNWQTPEEMPAISSAVTRP